jgi:hypothetical protein
MQTTTLRPNESARIEHMAQRGDPNRQSCPKASTRTHSGLRFGPEMRRPGQPARPLVRPRPSQHRLQAISPILPCGSLLRALLLLSVAGAATPSAGVRLLPPTTEKKPLLPSHPDAALGRRRPPFNGHSKVG